MFFLAHMSHRLKVSYFDRLMSGDRQELLQMTSPKLLVGLYPNVTEMILIWRLSIIIRPISIVVQMFLVCYISRSQRLKYIFEMKI